MQKSSKISCSEISTNKATFSENNPSRIIHYQFSVSMCVLKSMPPSSVEVNGVNVKKYFGKVNSGGFCIGISFMVCLNFPVSVRV